MAKPSCDCLNRCGDDARVAHGAVQPCPNMLSWWARARIVGAQRDSDDPNAIVVIYDRPPDDSDLVYLQTRDRRRWP